MKVLHVMNAAVSGGISMVVLNMYRAADKEKLHFDCAMYDTNLGANGLALKELGCEIFKLPLKSRHPIAHGKELIKILKQGQYDAIHVHNNETSYFSLFAAKLAGTPIRIAHAHTAREHNGFLGKLKARLSQALTSLAATKLVACSEGAALSIFGKQNKSKCVVLNNAIPVSKFAYNETVRNQIRRELGVEGCFVLGCVGNLGPEKNVGYALRILAEARKAKDNARLVLVGDGVLREELEQTAKDLGLEDAVLFLGRKANVYDYLQAMDAYLMPSLYEGFPVAAVEAAASGLPVFLSANIVASFDFYAYAQYLSISEDPKNWADAIVNLDKNIDRQQGAAAVKQAGYDLADYGEAVLDIYYSVDAN